MKLRGVLAVGVLLVTSLAFAHEVPCPLCGLKVVQNTKTQDNEVVLRFGRKKIEYRCVYCVLADANRYDGDLFVYAPSETKGKPVILQRVAGEWSAVKESEGKLVPEEGVVFLNDVRSHAKCAMLSRAFRGQEAFDRYVVDNKVSEAKALTLADLLKAVQAK